MQGGLLWVNSSYHYCKSSGILTMASESNDKLVRPYQLASSLRSVSGRGPVIDHQQLGERVP